MSPDRLVAHGLFMRELGTLERLQGVATRRRPGLLGRLRFRYGRELRQQAHDSLFSIHALDRELERLVEAFTRAVHPEDGGQDRGFVHFKHWTDRDGRTHIGLVIEP